MSRGTTNLKQLMAAGGLDARITEAAWREFVEHAVETLDVGPGTGVFDVFCGAGAFLLPLSENGYVVGGLDRSTALIDRARQAMPSGRWRVGEFLSLDPGEAWDVVLASSAFAGLTNHDEARGVLARMAAKAKHAVAILNVPESGERAALNRAWFLRALAEVGARAIQFDDGHFGGNRDANLSSSLNSSSFNVFARI